MPEVDVCGGEVVDAFVIALMVVVIDERLDLRLQICWKEVVPQGLVPSLYFALCLRVICPPNVPHSLNASHSASSPEM